MDPATQDAVANAATTAAATVSSFDTEAVLHMLWQGRLTVIPLLGCSVIAIAIVIQQLLRLRGLDRRSRELTRGVVDAVVKHDLVTARSLCESAKTPLAGIFLEGLRWRNIALEDLNGVLATSRGEAVTELRRGLWVLGTIGSLAPFIGLFGTVWGILRSFHDMATQGSGGFAVHPLQEHRGGDDLAHAFARVQRRARVLEDELDLAAEWLQRPAAQVRDVAAAETQRAASGLEQAHDAPGQRALATARLPDDPQRLPLGQADRDVVHGVHDTHRAVDEKAVFDGEIELHVLGLQ